MTVESRGAGRPTALTREALEDIVKVVSTGVPWAYCAATAKVSTRTLHDWMSRGERESSRLADDPDAEPDDREAIYAELYVRSEHAHQLAIQRNLMYVQMAARGGYVTEESTRKNRDGSVETTVKKTSPDWRAADKFLQYVDRRRFGQQAQQVELSGPSGGPIAVEGMGGLAARLAQRAIEDGNTVDGEVVEDDE